MTDNVVNALTNVMTVAGLWKPGTAEKYALTQYVKIREKVRGTEPYDAGDIEPRTFARPKDMDGTKVIEAVRCLSHELWPGEDAELWPYPEDEKWSARRVADALDLASEAWRPDNYYRNTRFKSVTVGEALTFYERWREAVLYANDHI